MYPLSDMQQQMGALDLLVSCVVSNQEVVRQGLGGLKTASIPTYLLRHLFDENNNDVKAKIEDEIQNTVTWLETLTRFALKPEERNTLKYKFGTTIAVDEGDVYNWSKKTQKEFKKQLANLNIGPEFVINRIFSTDVSRKERAKVEDICSKSIYTLKLLQKFAFASGAEKLELLKRDNGIGMFLFSLAVRLKPQHQLELDCRGQLEVHINQSDKIANVGIKIAEIKSSCKSIERAVEQLDFGLEVLNKATEVIYGLEKVNVLYKIGLLVLQNSARDECLTPKELRFTLDVVFI